MGHLNDLSRLEQLKLLKLQERPAPIPKKGFSRLRMPPMSRSAWDPAFRSDFLAEPALELALQRSKELGNPADVSRLDHIFRSASKARERNKLVNRSSAQQSL